jgi:hypothetical protein
LHKEQWAIYLMLPPKFVFKRGRDAPFIYLAIFVILALTKSPGIFQQPRFWAEEGLWFFAPLQSMSPLEALTHPYLGSFPGLTNIAVYVSTLVPIQYAPSITTYFSLAFTAVLALQIGLFAKDHGLSTYAGSALIVAWTFLPQNYEIWMTSTNLQWIAGVSMLMVLALSGSALDRHPRLYTAWTIVCGLSGVPATILAPAFLIRAFFDHRRALYFIAPTLTMCAVIQFWLVISGPSTARQFSISPTILFIPMLLQSVLSPLFSADFATAIGNAIKTHYPQITAITLGTAGASILIMAASLFTALTTASRAIVFYIFGTWIFVSLVQTVGALYADPQDLLSGWIGGRYYLFGSSCLCMLLALGTTSPQTHLRIAAGALLTLICVTGISQRYTSRWPRTFLSGPSWQSQLNGCAKASACHLLTWPDGGAWYVDVVK